MRPALATRAADRLLGLAAADKPSCFTATVHLPERARHQQSILPWTSVASLGLLECFFTARVVIARPAHHRARRTHAANRRSLAFPLGCHPLMGFAVDRYRTCARGSPHI